jgi:hypothetical protein
MACLKHPVLNGAWAETGVVEKGLIERIRCREVHIIADQIHELEGPHAKLSRVFHDSIDGLNGGVSVSEDA